MREWRAIHKRLKYLPMVLIVVLLILLSACASGGTGYSQLFTLRTTSLLVLEGQTSGFTHTGSAPFKISALVNVQVKTDESLEQDVAVVEIDFGDGSGWQDVTEVWKSKLDHTLYDESARAQPHTYDTPGEYSVQCRVTFADGQIFVCPDASTPSYTVIVEASTA